MKATFMSVWMGASMKASMNFTRKRLPGFRCFRRICPSNFRTFGGNGSRSSFRGSFHGSSFHGRLRESRGYRTTSPSPSLRDEDPLTEGSPESRTLSPRPWRKCEEFHERTPVLPSTKYAPTARCARLSTATFISVVLRVLQRKPTKRRRATPCSYGTWTTE